MDADERMACSLWAKNAILKSAGEGDPLNTYEGFAANASYTGEDWIKCMMERLPEELAIKICWLATKVDGFWNVWPMLEEAELGTVMQAGAINFFTDISDTTRDMIKSGDYRWDLTGYNNNTEENES